MNPEFVEQFHFGESTRVACPECSFDRKKKNSKDMILSRKPDGAVVYFCHHCMASGSVQSKKAHYNVTPMPAPKLMTLVKNQLQGHHYAWLMARGISATTADKAGLFAAERFFGRLDAMHDSIGFPYFRGGQFVGAKYRAIPEKDFTQDAGGGQDFFNIDNIVAGHPIIIVEGEVDCLTLMEAGIVNALSVPTGAPLKVADGKVSPSEDKRFGYVWAAREALEAAPYIVLATDQDVPGQALAEELARRIGKEKCRIAKFSGKDLNDVFNDPTQTTSLQEIVDGAQPYPISGLSDASTYADRLNDLYSKGTGSGFSTGYQSIDTIYTVAPGQLTVVTGYPSSGKSNFIDQVMVNLAKKSDWKFAVCSFENQPEIHISRLMEIYTEKRFFDGKARMSKEEADEALKWVNDHFLFIDSQGEEPNTLDSILDRARIAVKRMGIRGLVIDPYNYIELPRGDGTETSAISDMLTRVQKFCKSHVGPAGRSPSPRRHAAPGCAQVSRRAAS